MTGGATADARLERLLYVLPAAMREEGAALSELAEALETTEERIAEDLEELTSRVYYRPGGWPDDIRILLEPDRVRVLHATGFERPVRLSRDETLCLAMALRGGAAAARLRRAGDRDALLSRAEAHLGRTGAGSDATLGAPERDSDPDTIRETLMHAARERRPCALWYVKASAEDGSVRVVHPYAVVYAEGTWYAVAYCTLQEGVRVFRMDRVLAADVADGSFTVPDDFRVDDYVRDGRVFDGSGEEEVQVRYSDRIARWIREQAGSHEERLEDDGCGGVIVRHEVADPSWAVGQVLQYAPEAEVVGPEEVRTLVRETLERVLR